MTAGSKQHKATTGVPDGRLFLIEKKGIVENEEDMETSVYRDSCPDHDFNCITDYIGSRKEKHSIGQSPQSESDILNM